MEINMLFFAVALLGVCFPLYFLRKFCREHGDDDEGGSTALSLSSPLLTNSSNHRLDAALRDAEEGYNRCKLCGFENFKRFSFCSICGDSVAVPHAEFVANIVRRNTTTSASLRVNSRSSVAWERSASARHKSYEEIVTAAHSEQKSESREYTERQLRARKRKEWTRKLDIKGNVFWYRDGCHATVDLRYPGFVVQFQPRRKRATYFRAGDLDIDNPTTPPTDASSSTTDSISEPEPSLSSLTQSSSESDERGSFKPIRVTIERCAEVLRNETLPIEIKLTDATVVDAARMPLTGMLSSPPSVQLRDTIRIATRSFPTKYAHFVTSTAILIVPPKKEVIHLNLNRATLFVDSIESLGIISSANIRLAMRISFLDECGVDAGGLQREWFVLLNEELTDPRNGVFHCVNKRDQAFYLNSNSLHDIGENHLAYFFAAGRLIGRALLEGQVLGLHLALPLLKIILGVPIAFTDLEHFDSELYKSLQWMIENDVESLGLDFTVTEKQDDEFVVVDLIRNGRRIDVTEDNKDFYLERRFMRLLFESVSNQLYAFLKGLYEVIPQEMLMLFDPEELNYLLCGSDEIDVDDWERNTRFSEDLLHHPAMVWFWEIVREMPNEYRRRLLQFATGSSRVPIAGFSALTSYDGQLCPFTLKGAKLKDDGYIWSHACFNRLDLPLHSDRQQLKAVMYAALETETYDFTTNALGFSLSPFATTSPAASHSTQISLLEASKNLATEPRRVLERLALDRTVPERDLCVERRVDRETSDDAAEELLSVAVGENEGPPIARVGVVPRLDGRERDRRAAVAAILHGPEI